jgi:Na+-translocating ferredoxin:NAD+ oxidoreductase RnfC subunit
VKYQNPPRALVVNGAESEPGYYADKLLMRDEPEALVDVFEWLHRTFSMDVVILGAEEVAKPYLTDLERLARRLHNFSIGYFASKYKYGQERALCKVLLGMEIPASDLPYQHGVVVNNNETLFNMYRAVFQDVPVTTKFTHVYGEIGAPKVFEAPIGALAADLLRIYGAEPADFRDCKLYDGGPILAELAHEKLGDEPDYAITKTTNALLVVHPAKDRPRNKHYPTPEYETHHNSIDAPFAANEIVDVCDRIDRVRVPRKAAFGEGAKLCVREGDLVQRGDTIGHPTERLSVGVHASIDGQVTRITPEYVQVDRRS